MSDQIQTHPIQVHLRPHKHPAVPQVVTLRAYEVYCKVFRPQEALVTGGCRGGFGATELIAFLYARSFPQSEWSDRFDEAICGMEGF